jgi:hypothetical protein
MQTARDELADTFMEMFGMGRDAKKSKDVHHGRFMGYRVTIEAPPLIRELFLKALKAGREQQQLREQSCRT